MDTREARLGSRVHGQGSVWANPVEVNGKDSLIGRTDCDFELHPRISPSHPNFSTIPPRLLILAWIPTSWPCWAWAYPKFRATEIFYFSGSTDLYQVTDDRAVCLPSKLYSGSSSGIYASTISSSSWSFAPQLQVSYPKRTWIGSICV